VEALDKDWVFAEGLTVALSKEFLRKNLHNFFAKAVGGGLRQRLFLC
jgi:hypothetical protein